MAAFLSNYRIGEVIGQGSFGSVVHAVRIQDGLDVAIKTISRSNPNFDAESFEREVENMKSIHHPHIIGLVDHLSGQKSVAIV